MFDNPISGARPLLPALCLVLLFAACSPSAAAPGAGARPAASLSAESAESAQSPVKKLPLAYTEDYALFEGAAGGNRLVGLLDKTGRVLLPAGYLEISVSEKGIIFAGLTEKEKDVFRIFDGNGKQIGRDYNWIECASFLADGSWCSHKVTDMEIPPAPPYAASTEDGAGRRSYWLLDENGVAGEAEPYGAMELYDDGSVAAVRGGIRYDRAPDGTVTKSGGEVTQRYFDGKYQVKIYYPYLHGRYLSLTDKDGKEIAPAKYSTIDVPFADRYVLCEGDFTYMGGEQAFLYDDENQLLASDSNGFNFIVEPDGSYIGTSFVGDPYYDDGESQDPGSPAIMGADGKPEPSGAYFVDKNGKRLSERYKRIECYQNEAQFKEIAALEAGAGSYVTTRIDSLDDIADRAASGRTDPGETFFLVLATDGKAMKLPLKDLLLRQIG